MRISNTPNERLASTETGRPLPSLPSEIIGNICNLLYHLENEKTPSTVQRFINDPSTPAALRRHILRDIPVVVASGGVADLQNQQRKSEIANMVGSHPLVLLPHQLDEKSPLPGSSVTVLVNLHRWPTLENELPMLCQYPWHNLILLGDGYQPRDERMTIMKHLGSGLRSQVSVSRASGHLSL